MTQPKRLLEARESELDVALLQSALDDEPPAGLRDRTLTALGITAVVGATVTTASVASASTQAAATGATSGASTVATGAVAKTAGAGALAKWIAIAGVVGVASVGSVAVVRDRAHPTGPKIAVPTASAARTSAAQSHRPPVMAPPREPPIVVPSTTAEPTASASADRHPPAAPAPSTRLAEEVRLLDKARAALNGGAPDECLGMLEEYDARFPNGELKGEAAAVRARAESARGGRAQ